MWNTTVATSFIDQMELSAFLAFLEGEKKLANVGKDAGKRYPIKRNYNYWFHSASNCLFLHPTLFCFSISLLGTKQFFFHELFYLHLCSTVPYLARLFRFQKHPQSTVLPPWSRTSLNTLKPISLNILYIFSMDEHMTYSDYLIFKFISEMDFSNNHLSAI